MMKNRTKLLHAVFALTLVACSEAETEPAGNTTADSGAVMLVDAGFAANDSGTVEMDAGTSTTSGGMGWNDFCGEAEDCSTPTDFCVKQPNEPNGYCSIRCSNNAECTTAGVPGDWTCNTVFMACDGSDFTWCGPKSEIDASGGFVSECP